MKVLRATWWKYLAVGLVFYALIGGMLIDAPRLAILNETIRNLFYHVGMWFAMTALLTVSLVYSIRYLRKQRLTDDILASEFAFMALVFGALGIATGSFWARFTWGAWWVPDVKLTNSAIAMLIYLAYLVVRMSFEDVQQRAQFSAVFNIFAYAALVPLIFILPRMANDSLHPGNGGNPGFNVYDLDNNLRRVFYPAIVGWILLGVWVVSIRSRIRFLQLRRDELD